MFDNMFDKSFMKQLRLRMSVMAYFDKVLYSGLSFFNLQLSQRKNFGTEPNRREIIPEIT